MDHLRLFTAVRPPSDIIAAIRDAQDELRERTGSDSVRWVREENFHITLHFLGRTPVEMVEVVSAALVSGAQGISNLVELRLAGIGAFPSVRRPRTLWAGVEDRNGSLTAIEARLRRSLLDLGFDLDERPFRPHVTIGYLRKHAAPAERARVSAALGEVDAGPRDFEISDLLLVQSVTGRGGSVYTDLRKIAVGG